MKRESRLISVQGVPMLIFDSPECISDDIVKYNNFWEFELFNKWKHHFPSKGLMLDLGANIGSHCLQFKHWFPDIEILAFELDYNNFRLLSKNVKGIHNILCFNVGVGSHTSIVNFDNGHFSNSGVVKIAANGENQNIVLALDDLHFQKPINFIKIDIEGHELSAFEGMTTLLENNSPMIWLEDITENKGALSFLFNLGYKLLAENKTTDDYLVYK